MVNYFLPFRCVLKNKTDFPVIINLPQRFTATIRAKVRRHVFWRPHFIIWRLKKKIQSPVGACLKMLISDPGKTLTIHCSCHHQRVRRIKIHRVHLENKSHSNLSDYQPSLLVKNDLHSSVGSTGPKGFISKAPLYQKTDHWKNGV